MAKKVIELVDFLNPFDNGVNYEMFLASLPEGLSIQKHLEGKLSEDKIEWLLNDIQIYKQSKNK